MKKYFLILLVFLLQGCYNDPVIFKYETTIAESECSSNGGFTVFKKKTYINNDDIVDLNIICVDGSIKNHRFSYKTLQK
jgi:hypothetical protein